MDIKWTYDVKNEFWNFKTSLMYEHEKISVNGLLVKLLSTFG